MTRAQFDADRSEGQKTYTEFPTPTNQHQLNCGYCSRSLYVDEPTYESAAKAINTGLDNPFLCDDCREELGELERLGG